LAWLFTKPTASTEMERRRALIVAREGMRPQAPERLCREAPDHLNANVWKSGRVPGVTGR
jgi:hypothetical protein